MKGSDMPSLNVQPSEDLPVEEMVDLLRGPATSGWPAGWHTWPAAHEAHRRLAREFLQAIPPCPDRFRGRGVVICAGGHRLFTNGYVCATLLRKMGCKLPIQFWHFENEMDDQMRQLVAPLGVTCIDATAVNQGNPRAARSLGGWELKPFAILHCPFREILLLDADNVPVVDPTFLFDTPEYRVHGAIFWPDYGRLSESRQIWEICEVPYRNEPEFESGQIVVDKVRCWKALNLAMHYNEHSDFYFRHIHGDKDTFHLAFHRAGHEYAMPSREIHGMDGTMCQHDFQGRRIFQHRNTDKWRLDGSNRHISDFWCEDNCRDALRRLQERWSGHPFRKPALDEEERALFARLGGKCYDYRRVGYDHRVLELVADGTVGRGGATNERFWCVNRHRGRIVLSILGDGQLTCHLSEEQGLWKGAWLRHERMPIVLTPLAPAKSGP